MSVDSESPIRIGEKVHLMVRRLFDGDLRRHFAGTVVAQEGGLVRLEGYAFVFYPDRNQYVRRDGLRTRIVSIGDPLFVVNMLPEETDIERLHYSLADRRLVVTDGDSFALDINEFGSTH